MDTFFCSGDFSAFSAAFPSAGTADFYFLQGENEWAKQKLFAALCTYAATAKIQYTRVLHAHNAAKVVAVYLPQQHRFAADADNFPSLLPQHPHAKRFCAPALVRVPSTAGAEQTALLLQASAAQTRAEAYLRTAAEAQNASADLLARCADSAKVFRAVLEVLNAAAPRAKSAHGKVLFRRKLSAATAWGIHTVYAPFRKKGMRIAVLRDVYGGVAPLFLRGLCTACTAAGLDAQLYTALLSDTPVHLVLPACGIAFFTENDLHPFPFPETAALGASRFLRRREARAALPELRAYRDTAAEALACAAFSLYTADEARAKIRQFAALHTDSDALRRAQDELTTAFFSFRHFAE